MDKRPALDYGRNKLENSQRDHKGTGRDVDVKSPLKMPLIQDSIGLGAQEIFRMFKSKIWPYQCCHPYGKSGNAKTKQREPKLMEVSISQRRDSRKQMVFLLFLFGRKDRN